MYASIRIEMEWGRMPGKHTKQMLPFSARHGKLEDIHDTSTPD